MRTRWMLWTLLLVAVQGARGQEPDRVPPRAVASTPDAADPPAATGRGPAADGTAPPTGAEAEGRPADNSVPRAGAGPTSSNPAAVNIITGSGALGRFLVLDDDSGIRLGGLWIGDASGVLSGGQDPGRWGLNSLTIVDLNLNTEKMFGRSGGSFGTEFLQYTGQPTNELAGAFPGFDSLEGPPPLTRQELYQLWYRQALFDEKLIFRVGKMVPTYDFNNVVKPVPVGEPTAAIPAVTSLIYTPIFVNPTMLGVMPGYYNSATGITTTFAPTKSVYANYGAYDGSVALGKQTGLEGPHFNGHYFHIGEVGYAYRLGPQRKPGNFGVGVWGQTGKLPSLAGGQVNGAVGTYLFGSQRLWFRRPGVDSSGVSGFYQFGANSNDALRARQYVGGGLTAFGLVPARPDDTFGVGIASTWLTRAEPPTDGATGAQGHAQFRSNQLILSAYYQMQLTPSSFFQTTLTDIPNPGVNATLPNAFAITFRLITLF